MCISIYIYIMHVYIYIYIYNAYVYIYIYNTYIYIHTHIYIYIRSDDVAMEAGGDLRRIGHWTRALAFLELMRAAQARDRDETRVGDETTWSTPDPKK